MRKLFFISLLINGSIFCIAQTNKQGYELKMKFTNVKDTTCILMHHYGEKQMIKDTAHIDAKGNAVFKGSKTLDGGMYLLAFPSKKYFELIIDREQFFSLQCDTINMVKSMKIKGSQDNEKFYEYLLFIENKSAIAGPLSKSLSKTKNQDSIKSMQKQLADIEKEVKQYKKDYVKNNPQSFLSKIFNASAEVEIPETPSLPNGRKDSTFPYRYNKAHYWDNVDLNDDRLMRSPVIHNKVKFYFEKMILQSPDTIIKEVDALAKKASGKEIYKYIVYYVTFTYETSKYMGMDAVFVHMGNSYYYKKEQSPWVDSVSRAKIMGKVRILEKLLIGLQAPPLTVPDSTGAFNQLYNANAKYTVLFFWDPECGHCKKSTPKLKEFYEKYKDQGVEVFAVDIEDNKDAWKKYLRDNNLKWINCSNGAGNGKVYYNLKTYYDVYSTPVIYILDEKKKIIAKRIDAEQLEGYFVNQLKLKKK